MNHHRTQATVLLFLALTLAHALPALGAEGWAQFEPGTWVHTRMHSSVTKDGSAMKTTIDVKQTLLRIEGDEAVLQVETDVKTTIDGEELEQPPTNREDRVPFSPAAHLRQHSFGIGDESVDVAGRTFNCHVVLNVSDSTGGASRTESKVWFTDEVPGALVKSENTTKGASTGTGSAELIEYEVKTKEQSRASSPAVAPPAVASVENPDPTAVKSNGAHPSPIDRVPPSADEKQDPELLVAEGAKYAKGA